MIEVAVFISGLFLGSFFHTLSIRFIDGTIKSNPLKALFSRSKCRFCGKEIHPFHLVPVLGYLVLRGKCASCEKKISALYISAEIFYGLLALFVYTRLDVNLYSICILLMLCVAASLSMVDFKTMMIPDSLVVSFSILSIYPIIMNASITDNFFGFLLMGGFFLVILLIFPGAFGAGDLKFASAVGLACGLELSLIALESSLITGAIAGVIYALRSGKGFRTKIPFGPFLAAGFFIALFFGRDLLLIYYRLIY